MRPAVPRHRSPARWGCRRCPTSRGNVGGPPHPLRSGMAACEDPRASNESNNHRILMPADNRLPEASAAWLPGKARCRPIRDQFAHLLGGYVAAAVSHHPSQGELARNLIGFIRRIAAGGHMKPGAFDEMGGFGEGCRPCYAALKRWLDDAPPDLLDQRRKEAELLFRRIGITFAVYGEQAAQERLIPFDIIPRVIAGEEWGKLSLGLEQRVKALNTFLKDVYGSREIVRAGVVPEELILCNPYFRPEMAQLRLVGDIYVAIAGIDVVRVDADTFYVLEDNARTPSGVSYMLENREAMIRLFPKLFARQSIAPVDGYPDELLATLHSIAPRRGEEPCVVLLTPGPYNSAYYEHSFLADKLGIELVEGRDLFVRDETVFMRTTQGPKRVDVIYSRIDDDFLDPLVFRPDSLLGVPGLMLAYRAGNVSLANAVGTGVADDKAIYSYMPEIVRFYLGEEPIL